MSALQLRKPRATLHPSEHTIELRRRVERLELLRGDAVTRRDRDSVEHIDKQIERASAQWADSFAADHAESYRKTG